LQPSFFMLLQRLFLVSSSHQFRGRIFFRLG